MGSSGRYDIDGPAFPGTAKIGNVPFPPHRRHLARLACRQEIIRWTWPIAD